MAFYDWYLIFSLCASLWCDVILIWVWLKVHSFDECFVILETDFGISHKIVGGWFDRVLLMYIWVYYYFYQMAYIYQNLSYVWIMYELWIMSRIMYEYVPYFLWSFLADFLYLGNNIVCYHIL